MEKNSKKLPKKRIILLIGAAALLVINIVFYSLGWFTFSSNSSTNGMDMLSDKSPFELRTEGKAYSGEDVPVGYKLLDILELSDFGDVNGDKTSNQTGEYEVDGNTTGSYSVNWLLSDESNFGNSDVYSDTEENEGLKPGSRGKLVFYIKPHEDKAPMTISCIPQLVPYKLTTSGEKTTGAVMNSETANNFLKGHILFFRDYNESSKTYSDPVIFDGDDLAFEVEITSASEVMVELYWIWPNTLPELLLESYDDNLLGRHNILDNINPEEVEPTSEASGSTGNEVPAKQKLLGQMKAHKNYYFYADTLPTDSLLDDLANHGSYLKQAYIAACTAYNNADQFIGTNISCIVLKLVCSVK